MVGIIKYKVVSPSKVSLIVNKSYDHIDHYEVFLYLLEKNDVLYL